MGEMTGRGKRPCLIFGARPVAAALVAGALARLAAPPLVIAADAGWQQAQACGLLPEVVVGDFDSSPPPPAAWQTGERAVRVLALPPEKDDTDLHCAARQALLAGVGETVLLGVLGGRADHGQASLATLLFLCQNGAKARIADKTAEIHCVLPGESLRLPRREGCYLSVFPAFGRAAGVQERGVKYPLTNALLTADFPLGVSNEFAAETAEISCREGGLFVYLVPKDGD